MKWFLDWDGTLTTHDTLSIVASIGYNKNKNRHQEPELPPWSYFSETYKTDYDALLAKLKSEGRESTPTSLNDYLKFQERMVDVERASVERVEQAGIFANVTTTDIDNAAEEAMQSQAVALRPGFDALFHSIDKRGDDVTIISVNWSARFIKACLQHATQLQFQSGKGFTSSIRVRANDIEPGPSSRLSRTFEDEDRGIWTGQEKSKVMGQELQNRPQPGKSAYIGDSPSDLPCLLRAEVGICIRDSHLTSEQRSLQELLSRFNIACHPIEEYSPTSIGKDASFKRLWWAKDFHDVCSSALLASPETAPGESLRERTRS